VASDAKRTAAPRNLCLPQGEAMNDAETREIDRLRDALRRIEDSTYRGNWEDPDYFAEIRQIAREALGETVERAA
jgi:hypothetical protein